MLSPEVRPASLRRVVERRAGHQRLDALVHIAEPLLEPHHVLAVGGEAEMAGLDDAGMHRPDRDLMQAFALDRQEGVRRRRLRARLACAERMAHVPEAEVEPRPRVGRADGVEPEEIADRALEPDRRRMRARRRWDSVPSGAGEAEHGDVADRSLEQRHVHVAGVAPQAEQRRAAAASARSPAASRRRRR